MRLLARASLCVLATSASITQSGAASLQVSTVKLDVAAPAAATSLTLRNEGTAPIDAQLRVFAWRQTAEGEKLVPTADVVASPPAAKLAPGRKYTVRIVRLNKTPVESEESYRLFVDELPSKVATSGQGINFALRYSIPVFFRTSSQAEGELVWQAANKKGALQITATNRGPRHLRFSTIEVKDENGTAIVGRKGMVGYVLAGSSMRWTFPTDKNLSLAKYALISADSEGGPLNARTSISKP